MMRNHVITFRSDLRYDGRVCAMIRTLALAFPEDRVYLYELLREDAYDLPTFPNNVIIKRPYLLSKQLPSNKLSKIFVFFEFYMYSLCFLLYKRPATIQLHYEVCLLPSLLYKLLFRRSKLIYNDQELYHHSDKNIPSFFYWIEYAIIKYSDILIETNEYRRKAVFYIHKNEIRKCVIIDNYVFEPTIGILDQRFLEQIYNIKSKGLKILLHQGTIDPHRGEHLLLSILGNIPEDWTILFIGISEQDYSNFISRIPRAHKEKTYWMGFIPYKQLNSLYCYIDAAALFYGDQTYNNKYCAPNRLYSAVNNGVPIIVNKENVTLSDFIRKFNNGVFIPEFANLELFFDKYSYYREIAFELKGKFQYGNTIDVLMKIYKEIC